MIRSDEQSEKAIEIKNKCFSWGSVSKDKDDGSKKDDDRIFASEKGAKISEIITLENINLNVKKGEFVCVIGNVGSGKSSLLSTIIGDLLYVS